VSGSLARRAGDALTWKAIQLGGTKGIFFVRTLLLATLLSPDDFGLFAIAIVAVGFLMSTTDLGVVPALVHRPEAVDANYDGAWTVGVVRALGISAVLVLAAPLIAAIVAEPRAVAILRVLALKPLIDAATSIRIAELVRNLNYQRLACVSLPAVAVETVISLALATTFGVWALVVGALMGGVAGVLSSYLVAPSRPRLSFDGPAVRPLIHYGRWIFLTGLVATSASSLTQVVIARQLGAFELGLYVLATKLAFLPYEIGNQVIGEVAFPLFARIQHDQVRVAGAFQSILVGTVTCLLPLYVFLISLAPWVVQDVFGARWTGTEPLIRLLALVGIAGLFGDTCGPLFRGLGYPKWALAVEFVQSCLVVVLAWSLTRRYGASGTAFAWLIGVAVSQLLYFVLARRVVERPLAGASLPASLVLVSSIAGAGAAVAVRQLVPGAGGLLMAVLIAVSLTAMLIWFGDRSFRLGIGTILTLTFPQVAGLIGVVRGR
jgi:lipopolysaccharide exporter